MTGNRAIVLHSLTPTAYIIRSIPVSYLKITADDIHTNIWPYAYTIHKSTASQDNLVTIQLKKYSEIIRK